MENLITPVMKDELLSLLVANCELNTYLSSNHPKPLLDIAGSRNNLQAIFNQFCRLGLLSKGVVSSNSISVVVNVEAHDFLSRGGFTAQEEILKANINKLGLELESLSKELEPKFAEKASTIMTIANNILSVVGFLER
ncbi:MULTISPECIES: hypothetical protein [Butyricimonas]|uniref:hypothetical protein n=1 Tax=Butyricimonas TaxID=574697 RepID=UPI001D072D9A|nr:MULTISPECIES: hypothetical protein [Butyricimonas]MCB6971852.1 hypothetical protein [Butyricimonas synergistica]MCG4518860.1 hypothetical protein [Butyricimonas sp. DFI.6.44]